MLTTFIRALGAILLPVRYVLIGIVTMAANTAAATKERPEVMKWLALAALAATLAAVTALVVQ